MAKLTAADAADNDEFGKSVAIAGDTVVVGTSNKEAVYVFLTTDGGATYGQVAKLTASDAAANDYFGRSVAISAGIIAIGAMGDVEGGGFGSGSVYLFHTEDDGATWSEFAFLIASDAATEDYFGISVAISGVRVVVGAYKDDDAAGDSGAAYLFNDATPEPTLQPSPQPSPRPTLAPSPAPTPHPHLADAEAHVRA